MNTFGKYFRVTTFGESHGKALGAIIDGCPAGLSLSKEDFSRELIRRRPGQSNISSPRNEQDVPEVLSGIFEGKTLGTPIAVIVQNTDKKSKDYTGIKDIFRPGHADEVWHKKYGHRDYRGGGRQSGRETLGRCIGGAAAKKLLSEICDTKIIGHVVQIGDITAHEFHEKSIEKNPVRCADMQAAKKMEALIQQTKSQHDSLGGMVEIYITNAPKMCGTPVFGKIEAEFAKALLSIGTTRSFEYGEGMSVAFRQGSQQNPIREGISGGITTGEEIRIRVAVKPPPTIAKKQIMTTAENTQVTYSVHGRHDPVIAPRFVPVAESMVAIVLADALLAPASKIDHIFQ
jgi:chorismate synthase